MIKFEKVSFKQFLKSCEDLGIERSKDDLKAIYDRIPLPKRGTIGSAGYDFVTPFEFELNPGETITLPTGIRVILPQNKVLLLVPRSGLGFKNGMSLANTIGVIDSDYSYSSNEGHIAMKFVGGFKCCNIKECERVMQGIILTYDITDDDETKEIRNGGFGSTGKR